MNLKDYLDTKGKVGEIKLELRHPTGKQMVWVLVEGESDVKLYRKFLRGASVEEVEGGVENLRQTLAILVKETPRVLGIRDADFLILRDQVEETSNLFLTDAHDSEMMLISHEITFEALVAEDTNYPMAQAPRIRSDIMDSIRFLSGIRLLNDTEDMRLNFKGLGLGGFYVGETKTLDEAKCLAEINQRSNNKERSVNKAMVHQVIQVSHDLLQLTNGHDFLNAFALHATAHKKTQASEGKDKKGISEKDVVRVLRGAYTLQAFRTTNLFNLLKTWEQANGLPLFTSINT